MDLNYYQQEAVKTAVYPKEHAVSYLALGLNGEAGEVAEKVKKIIRDRGGVIGNQHQDDLVKELGDVLWYAANLASVLGVELEEVAQTNLDKLQSRQLRGVLKGSGDNR